MLGSACGKPITAHENARKWAISRRCFRSPDCPANSAAYYAAATRGHWGVENRVHYVLDVSMHEDASRVRKSPTILSILRSFALNILRFNKITDIADALWRNAMNFNRVLAYGGT
jgi:hypothetical protein